LGKVPETVKDNVALSKRIRRLTNLEIVDLQTRLLDQKDDILKAVRGRPSSSETVWIAKPFSSPMRDAFRQFKTEGTMLATPGWQRFAQLAHGLKAWTLSFDIFHGNVLTSAGLIANPAKMAALLRENPESFATGIAAPAIERIAMTRALPRTATGAAIGGLITAGTGGDADDVLVGSIAGAVWGNAIAAAMRSNVKALSAGLTPGNEIPLAYMGLHWPRAQGCLRSCPCSWWLAHLDQRH